MTEKELYKKAMAQNLTNPAEQSASQVRGGKRKYGYVKSSAWKFAAAAAVLALAVGAGTVVYLNGRNSSADEIRISQPDSIAAQPVSETESKTEKTALNYLDNTQVKSEEDKAMSLYKGFWETVAANPQDYVSVLSYQGVQGKEGYDQRSYWFSEDDIAEPANGSNLSAELAEGFANAENVRFLGYKSDNAVTVNWDELRGEVAAAGKGVISVKTRTGVPQNNKDILFMDYQITEKGAFLQMEENSSQWEWVNGVPSVNGRTFYYLVSFPNGKYPCHDGTAFTVPDWNQCESDEGLLMSANELLGQNNQSSYRFSSADDRVSYSFKLDFVSGNMPKITIEGMELPEGESIKNGEFRIHLDTEDKYGKNSEVVHPVAITEDIVKNGVTVDLANYAEQLNKQDIASVRVDAVFNTDAHTAAHHENYTHPNNEYAYTVFGYVGIDRTK